ncbi:putative MFS family arabinose efflux permease [Paenibacillus anaericanus]|uniref:MFS transporter n=1 Tax=Paenibacillus anaericanus TaxID=170367 RepID=UPI00278B3289|nr:MFS transporter [Paenibacillus anaericanus]MDQ0089011.1 putative MFS family arabinose efflux permease [Paenibacillus anaericanus]
MNFLKLHSREQNYVFITLILFFAGLAIMSSVYITIPLISVISMDFSVSEGRALWVSSSFTFSFAVGCLVFGPLSDRFGRKKIMLAGLTALTIVTFFLGFQSSLFFIILFRGIQGLAAATFSPVVLSYVVELFPQNKRVFTLSCMSTSFLTAGIIGQVFSSFVNAHLGWPYVFIILAAIYFILSLLIFFFIPNLPANGIHVADAFKQMRKTLGQKSLWFAYVVALVMLLSFVGMYTSLGEFLSSSHYGFTNQQILYVRSVGIFGMLMSLFSGRLIRKFGVISVLRSALILSAVGLTLLGTVTNMVFMIVMSIVFVSGIAVAIPSLVSLIGELGGPVRGAALSIYAFVVNMGATIGPILAVQLLNTGNYILTFLSLACCLLLGLLATFFVRSVSLDE